MHEESMKIKDSSELSIYWESHLKACESSNLNQSEYCRRNNLNYSVFHYWKRKLSKSGIMIPSAKLVQLDGRMLNGSQNSALEKSASTSPKMSPECSGLRLWVGPEYCIDIGENFSSTVLSRLLVCLRSV